MKKLPHLVQMHKTHADRGLVVMTVSVDQPADKAAALEKLREMGATNPNFLLLDEKQDEAGLMKFFGYEAEGGLPHTAVFDRAGRRIWDNTTGEAKSAQALEKLVEELLRQ